MAEEKPHEGWNPIAIGVNMSQIGFCRTAGSILAGVCAGILGLTSLHGLALYVLASLVLSVLLFLRVPGSVSTYFPSITQVVWDGILGSALTYVLFWTLAYGIIHVY